jgi:hypothetical protein
MGKEGSIIGRQRSHFVLASAIIEVGQRKTVLVCDLCGQAKECVQKEIEGKEYDLCSDCWKPLAEKLKGKGRSKKERETVFLPPIPGEPSPEQPNPLPAQPPKIWGGIARTQ